MISVSEMLKILCYAATSQQIEATVQTSVVYTDQLGDEDGFEVAQAVREWVRTYADPFRRLPTVGELRLMMERQRLESAREARREELQRQQEWDRVEYDLAVEWKSIGRWRDATSEEINAEVRRRLSIVAAPPVLG